MPTCRVCRKNFVYDDECGYDRELCGPLCDGIEAGRRNRAIPDHAVCFFMDGDKWCCVHGDFANLQESPAGFGDTFDAALTDLQIQIKEALCSRNSTLS